MKGEEAVRRLLAGEPDALEAIATAFTPLVHYVISAILEDPQEREECVADILHQVWRGGRSGMRSCPIPGTARKSRC